MVKQQLERGKRLQRIYGITELQWMKMFQRQQGLCPICRKPLHKPNNPAGRRASAVDHDHHTGRVRGLACYRCNKYLIGKHTKITAQRLLLYLSSTFDGREV